jgi:predicted nucleic acid-binding protein
MRLVADANVLLSAVIGGRGARLILENPAVEALTPQVTFAEVQEYALILAQERRLSPDTVLLAVAALPVTIVETRIYEPFVAEARRLILARDPEDVDVLALALYLNVPLWSNDNDFEETGIEWYTTAELLKGLRI